jgi:hypothetical protein
VKNQTFFPEKFTSFFLNFKFSGVNFKEKFPEIQILKIQELCAFGSRLHEYISEFSDRISNSVCVADVPW